MASLKDISKICGVSVATVSKALNDHKDIGEETKATIKRVAKEMGYSPNLSARALKTNRTYGIGVLFADEARSGLTHDYFSVCWTVSRGRQRRAVTTLHSLIAARTGRIGCPTWNTVGTEALTEWCSPVLISEIPKSSNWYRVPSR